MIKHNVLLSAVDVWKTYMRGDETVNALAGMNMELRKGEIVGIVGRSGSGKTTFLNQVGCLDHPTQGSLKILDTEVTQLKESELVVFRRYNIGFVFQLFYLIPTLSIYENIELPLIFSKKRDEKKVLNAIDRVGLKANPDLLPGQLNGGDMQKVALARAIVNEPKILLADEPTGRLETQSKAVILNLFRELAMQGLGIIIATHDLDLASKTDRVLELKDGKIINEKTQ